MPWNRWNKWNNIDYQYSYKVKLFRNVPPCSVLFQCSIVPSQKIGFQSTFLKNFFIKKTPVYAASAYQNHQPKQ